MAKHKPKLSQQILEEACSWFIDFNEGEVDTGGREKFNAWLRTSPEHLRAYLQISAFWEDADALNKRVDVDALVARAAAQKNIFPLELATRIGSEPGLRRKMRVPAAIAATVLLAIGAGVAVWYGGDLAPVYATEIGEQRSITLEDGSSVELNSRSRLKVRFGENRRSVQMLEGQALFRVARDPARPFVVRSDATEVRAVGTEFDVYKKSVGTIVTVVEGRVAVIAPAADKSLVGGAARGAEIFLGPGEQLTVTPTAVPVPRSANIAAATAWTEKKLIFESTPLREVVEEFNRYNRRQLVVRDPELYDFHISGVFPSTDSSRIVEFLRQRFGVTMNRQGETIEIARR